MAFSEDPGITGIAVLNSSTAYVVGYNDNNIYRVNLIDGTYDLVTPTPVGWPGSPNILSIALASPTRAYVVGNQDNNVYLVDLETGESTLVTSVPVDEGAALINVGLYGGKLYTVGNLSGNVYVVDLATGASRSFATIPGAIYWTGGMGIFAGEGGELSIPPEGLLGNNLVLARYLNQYASDALRNALAQLGSVPLDRALKAVLPTRNSLVFSVSQKALISSAHVIFNHLWQRRFAMDQMELLSAGALRSEEDLFAFDDGGARASCSLWAAPFFKRLKEREQQHLPAFSASQGGGIVGAEYIFGNSHTIGIAGSGIFTKVTQDNRLGDAKLKQGTFSLYGQYNLSALFFHAAISVGSYSAENHRRISFPGVNELAIASIEGWQLAPHFEIGYMNFKHLNSGVNRFNLEPFLGVNFVLNREKGFKERGAGDYCMGQKNRSASLFCLEHGVRLHQRFVCSRGEVVLREKISYSRFVPMKGEKMTAFLTNSSNDFVIEVGEQPQSLGVAEFSFFYKPFNSLLPHVGASYRADVGGRHQSHRIALEVGLRF